MLSVHLANIKSSGVYRFVFDKSEVTNTIPQTMRLVVGYSEKGPFNTVMYIKNEGEFREIYGNPSKKLEKYGCFFHRLALQALAKEPILCLNLKDFSDETLKAISFDMINEAVLPKAESIDVEKIFDASGLWTLSPEALSDTFDSMDGNKKRYITMSITDTKKCSNTVFMRPSLVKGYDISLRDWYNTYNNGEYPDYLEDVLSTLVSDYMVDVYIFRGQFTKEVATSPTFANYFTIKGDDVYVKDYVENAFGEKIDALQALSEVEGSGFITRYTGSLIPYFKGLDGSWMSIDLLVNSGVDRHNIMMYLDENMLETGKNAKNENFSAWNINLGGYNDDFKGGEDFTKLGSIEACFGTGNTCAYMYNVWTQNTAAKYEWETKEDSVFTNFTYGVPAIDVFGGLTEESDSTDFSKGLFTYAADGVTYHSHSTMPISVGDNFVGENGLVTVINIIDNYKGSNVDTIEIKFSDKPKQVTVTDAGKSIIRYNCKLTAHAGSTLPAEAIPAVTATGENGEVTVTKAAVAAVPFSNDSHKGVYLEGYTYTNVKPVSSSADNKNKWINSKLDVLKKKGLREALTNCADTDYRYIIDTFEAFPEDGLRSRLSMLAKDKGNAFVISNFPAMDTFKKDKMGGYSDRYGFNTKYIVQGHNRSKNTATNITMPSELNGASFIAFYTPLNFNDGGLKVTVPSAALVSNNFMDKYTSRQPYYIVAGPSYGLMSYDGLIGPDYIFTRDDLDNLEPMGVNCMVYKPQRGTFINSNQTAKQTPVTGLSKINIRELVIYLQDAIADMLQGYQWELNTQTLRDNIKTKADIICEAVAANGGLYAYKNVCDKTNNTDEVIDNEMIVLSTSIEPAKGAGKMVHELTIYRKGGMSSVIK